MEDFAEAEIIRIINKSAKLNEANLRGCLLYSQRAVFLQPQRFCGHEPVVLISIEALPQTVNVQCKFLELSIVIGCSVTAARDVLIRSNS